MQYCHLDSFSFAIGVSLSRNNVLFFVSVMGETYLDDEDLRFSLQLLFRL